MWAAETRAAAAVPGVPGPVDEVHERRALLSDQAGMGRYQQQDPRRAAGPCQEPLAKGDRHAHADRVANEEDVSKTVINTCKAFFVL